VFSWYDFVIGRRLDEQRSGSRRRSRNSALFVHASECGVDWLTQWGGRIRGHCAMARQAGGLIEIAFARYPYSEMAISLETGFDIYQSPRDLPYASWPLPGAHARQEVFTGIQQARRLHGRERG